MTQIQPTQVIDLTGAPADRLEFIEVRTAGGIIRINTGLEDTATGQPAIVVEISQNTQSQPGTEAGGDWDVRIRKLGLGVRTDVTLTRRQGT